MMRDLNQAISIIDAMKHWAVQCVNNSKRGRSYSCTLWNGGKRVTAYGRTPLNAIASAVEKLRDKAHGTGLRIVKGGGE